MKKFVWVAPISLLAVVLSSGHAQAATFTETQDAGEILSSAVRVISPELQPLESISGILSSDADLFRISLTGGQSFSATTTGGANFDTQLFLFDSGGKGVYGNDNAGVSFQSTLPIGGFSPQKSGTYYLGISGFDYDPVSTAGEIFTDFPDTGFDTVAGPTGAGGKSALSGFDGARLEPGGSYTIALTGAQTETKSVPEPSSVLGILAVGAWSIGALLKKTKPVL